MEELDGDGKHTDETAPVPTVAAGDMFVVETQDISTGRIHRREDVPNFVRVRDPRKVNPAAGPVFFEGASPVEIAVEELTGLLISRLGLSRTEAFLLVSAG
jgi:acetamidase/formamidase